MSFGQQLQGCRPAGADELSFFAMNFFEHGLLCLLPTPMAGNAVMPSLLHFFKLQLPATERWKWLSPQRQKSPESQGDQPTVVIPDEYLPGFEEVAAFISTEDEGGMYRRFRRLAARNVLYMQSELASLEDKLRRMDQGDKCKIDTPEGVNAFQCAIDWDAMRRLEPTDDKARERLALVMDIRKLMREYRGYSIFSKLLSQSPSQAFES